jgi:hypothetical protein
MNLPQNGKKKISSGKICSKNESNDKDIEGQPKERIAKGLRKDETTYQL